MLEANDNYPTVFMVDDHGEEVEVSLPTRWEVCSRCRGKGRLAMPGVSFSSEEMHEMGEDFIDDYISGVYDAPCPKCDGRTTVAVVDEDRMAPDVRAAWIAQEQSMWDMYNTERQERMMGA